jgi:hypothetical protein
LALWTLHLCGTICRPQAGNASDTEHNDKGQQQIVSACLIERVREKTPAPTTCFCLDSAVLRQVNGTFAVLLLLLLLLVGCKNTGLGQLGLVPRHTFAIKPFTAWLTEYW